MFFMNIVVVVHFIGPKACPERPSAGPHLLTPQLHCNATLLEKSHTQLEQIISEAVE